MTMEHLATLVATWQFEPVLTTAVVVSGACYAAAVRAVSRRHPAQPWSARHSSFFGAGLAAVVVVTLGPVGALDDTFFWAHMVQHLVLMMVAPPLLLLGAPVLLLLRFVGRDVRRRAVLPLLRSQVLAFFTRPLVSWLIFAAVLLGTHFTGFYEFALEHPGVHNYVEHALYLSAGLLYFYPLMGVSPAAAATPRATKAASLLLMLIPEFLVGLTLFSATTVRYAHYLAIGPQGWGPGSALLDQRLGGAIMLFAGLAVHGTCSLLLAVDWLRSQPRRMRRLVVAGSA